MRCASVQLSLGGHILGALGPRESRRITAHVAHCAACSAQLTELGRLRPLLDQLSLDDLETDLDLAGEARFSAAPRVGPRWGLVVAGVALAAVVAGGVATVVAIWPSSQATVAAGTAPSTVSVTDAATNVMVDARLTTRPSGTDITISLRGGNPGDWCWLVALGQDGRTQQFAGWEVTSRGDAMVTDHTEIPRADLRRLRVVRDDHTLLAEVPIG